MIESMRKQLAITGGRASSFFPRYHKSRCQLFRRLFVRWREKSDWQNPMDFVGQISRMREKPQRDCRTPKTLREFR